MPRLILNWENFIIDEQASPEAKEYAVNALTYLLSGGANRQTAFESEVYIQLIKNINDKQAELVHIV